MSTDECILNQTSSNKAIPRCDCHPLRPCVEHRHEPEVVDLHLLRPSCFIKDGEQAIIEQPCISREVIALLPLMERVQKVEICHLLTAPVPAPTL